MSTDFDIIQRDKKALIFDSDAFLERLQGDKRIAVRIIDVFIEQTPKYLSNIKSFMVENKFEQVENLAHSLKGSISTVAGVAMLQIVKDLEYSAKNRDSFQMNLKAQVLEQEFFVLKEELNSRRISWMSIDL